MKDQLDKFFEEEYKASSIENVGLGIGEKIDLHKDILVGDSGTRNAPDGVNLTELENSHYKFNLTQAETDGDVVDVLPMQSTKNPSESPALNEHLVIRYKSYKRFKGKCLAIINHVDSGDQKEVELESFKQSFSFADYLKLSELERIKNQIRELHNLHVSLANELNK